MKAKATSWYEPSYEAKRLEARRRRFVELLPQRLPSWVLAERLGVDPDTIRRWYAEFGVSGEEAQP